MASARPRRRKPTAGMAMTAMIVATVVAWLAGWTWVAAPAVLGILGSAAAVAGADTRSAGDWRRVETH